MAKPSTLTPSQAAAVLAVSATTLRRWSKDFGAHLSEDARGAETDRGGRHRSYTPDDIATLQRAGELLKTHAPAEVAARLGLADDTQAIATLATLPTVAAELRALRDALMLLRSDVEALREARQADRAELERLRGEVAGLFDRQRKRQAADRAELETMRAQLADLQARRHWWQRLRG